MCSVRKQGHDEDRMELSLGQICKVVNDLYNMGIKSIRLIGAEPMMRKDIIDIIKHIKAKGLVCDVATNGTLINKEMAKALVESKIDQIALSIDAPNKLHDKVRGVKGAFEKAIKGLQYLSLEKERRKTSVPRFNIRTTISSINCNIENLRDMVRFIEKNRIEFFSFGLIRETPLDVVNKTLFKGKIIGTTRFLPESDSLLVNEQSLVKMKKEAEEAPSLKNYLGMINYLSYDHLLKSTVPIRKCYQTHTVILINPYGDVIPCSNLDRYIFGNVLNENIMNIWKNSAHRELTNHLEKRFFPICDYCCHIQYTPLQVLKTIFGMKL
jgi:radical SAM protein with 4Fe4S-binding SPASM domain